MDPRRFNPNRASSMELEVNNVVEGGGGAGSEADGEELPLLKISSRGGASGGGILDSSKLEVLSSNGGASGMEDDSSLLSPAVLSLE